MDFKDGLHVKIEKLGSLDQEFSKWSGGPPRRDRMRVCVNKKTFVLKAELF